MSTQTRVCQILPSLAAASPPQDQPRDGPPLQVEYFPANGTYSLHYFPYYGKKAQVGVLAARACLQTSSD